MLMVMACELVSVVVSSVHDDVAGVEELHAVAEALMVELFELTGPAEEPTGVVVVSTVFVRDSVMTDVT